MKLTEVAFADVKNELANSRKILEKLPAGQLNWQPHKKSYTLGKLAQHIATLPRMFQLVATTEDFDLAQWQPPAAAESVEEILKASDEMASAALAALAGLSDEALQKTWTLRMGDHVILSLPRFLALRSFAISHIVHHRAQLTVYLRLLDVPVPGLYGPSADEQ